MRVIGSKPRMAWFSPLNVHGVPSESISAYASDQLLPLLRDTFDIELYHAGFDQYRNFPTYHYLSAFVRHRERPYDFVFYQLEDSKSSNFIRVHLGLMPGIVWFHDFIFTSFGPEPILNSPWERIVDKFNTAQGGWPERGAEFEQRGPLGFREAAWGALPIFSSPVAHAEYRRNVRKRLSLPAGEGEKSFYVPLPVARAPERRTGPDFQIAFCGSPRIEHRAHKILQALSNFQAPYVLHWLINKDERAQASELLFEFGISSYKVVTGRSPHQWREMSATCDVALHTLFSVYGQPDPYLAISLMAGVPSIVTRFGTTEYLPDNLVFKVEPGDYEAAEIRGVLEQIASGGVPNLSARTKEFAQDLHGVDQVARELSTVFRSSTLYMAAFQERWRAFESKAAAALVAEAPSYLPDTLSAKEDWKRLIKPTFDELGWK